MLKYLFLLNHCYFLNMLYNNAFYLIMLYHNRGYHDKKTTCLCDIGYLCDASGSR
ncbi:hypothetical protein AO368_0162 [Moraxella catarrhalis]|nr:hypothetical protein AO368_0162 [Moraxella catarrhalis]